MLHLIFNIYNILVLAIGGFIAYKCIKNYERTKSRPLLNSMPGVFTSLGILGTFLSICVSLNNIQVQVAISDIINELIPAFTSSIVGLLCALGVTVWTKNKFAKEDAEDSSRLKNKSPEDYIRDIAINSEMLSPQKEHLSQLVGLLKTQEEKNREYNDKLNENIIKQSKILKEFIDGFVNRMDQIFQQMQGAIEQQVKTFGEDQFNKTSEVLTGITKKLSEVSTQIIDKQRQSVETMMSNTNNEIGAISSSVTEEIGKLSASIQTALAALGTSQSERLGAIISNYDTLAEKLSQQNTTFAEKVSTQLQGEYQKVQQHNVDSLQQMIDLRDAYREATYEVMTNTIDMNEKVTTNLRKSMSEFVAGIQSSITTQCAALGAAITQNVESLNKAYQFIESLVAEIRQNYDQAVLAYGDAVNVAHRSNESTEKAIAATNKSLQSVEETNKKVGEVLNLLSERQENIEKLTKQINSVSATIEQLQRLESMLNKIGKR